jgi:hypothetical protein
MQVVHFNCPLQYYSPRETLSQEKEFFLLPNEKALVNIYQPIYNHHKYNLCLEIKNTSNKIIIIKQHSSLYKVLHHPNIKHHLLWVHQSVIQCLKKQWQRGLSTYTYLKYAFTLNNAGLCCGGIGAQC